MERGVPGVLVLVGIVALGLGSGAAYFHYKQPLLAAELQAKLDAAPKTPEGRLDAWSLVGNPQIHHRLATIARFSDERPWLVTHAVDDGAGQPEVWGVDCRELPRELAGAEGLTVVVALPAPVPLARVDLDEEHSAHVPVYPSAPEASVAAARLADLAFFFLEGMPKALARDIEGASLVIRIDGVDHVPSAGR
jgi:hypothetical protein